MCLYLAEMSERLATKPKRRSCRKESLICVFIFFFLFSNVVNVYSNLLSRHYTLNMSMRSHDRDLICLPYIGVVTRPRS